MMDEEVADCHEVAELELTGQLTQNPLRRTSSKLAVRLYVTDGNMAGMSYESLRVRCACGRRNSDIQIGSP
jgi:hypothetical protein